MVAGLPNVCGAFLSVRTPDPWRRSAASPLRWLFHRAASCGRMGDAARASPRFAVVEASSCSVRSAGCRPAVLRCSPPRPTAVRPLSGGGVGLDLGGTRRNPERRSTRNMARFLSPKIGRIDSWHDSWVSAGGVKRPRTSKGPGPRPRGRGGAMPLAGAHPGAAVRRSGIGSWSPWWCQPAPSHSEHGHGSYRRHLQRSLSAWQLAHHSPQPSQHGHTRELLTVQLRGWCFRGGFLVPFSPREGHEDRLGLRSRTAARFVQVVSFRERGRRMGIM